MTIETRVKNLEEKLGVQEDIPIRIISFTNDDEENLELGTWFPFCLSPKKLVKNYKQRVKRAIFETDFSEYKIIFPEAKERLRKELSEKDWKKLQKKFPKLFA